LRFVADHLQHEARPNVQIGGFASNAWYDPSDRNGADRSLC
jgi:hypothetical protein